MADDVLRLKVLVASPDDVQAERTSARGVIDELNQMLGGFSVRLEFVGWEDASPGVGTDPQTVVTEQLGDDYDIFVGILWTRFGTETPRAGSGTEEEFDRAHERWKNNPNSMEIMMFFSAVPADPTQIDVTQLAKVNLFRERVSNEGVFYHRFASREDFARALRIALMRTALKVSRQREDDTGGPSGAIPPPHPPTPPTEEEEVGLFELLELGKENFEWVKEAIVRMAQAQTELTERLTRRREQLEQTKDARLQRRYVDAAAEDLTSYADRTNGELKVFVSSYNTGMDAYIRVARMLPLFGAEGMQSINGARLGLRFMKNSLVDSGQSISSFRDSVASLPPLTTPVTRAKRRVIEVLDSLLSEWHNAINLADEMVGLLDELISRYTEPEGKA